VHVKLHRASGYPVDEAPLRHRSSRTRQQVRRHSGATLRELENALSRITLAVAGSMRRGGPVMLTASHLGPDFSSTADEQSLDHSPVAPEIAPRTGDLEEATRCLQRALIRRALAEHQGNWAAAARSLGMHRSNLHHLATTLGLKEREQRARGHYGN
jgi:anaerobic nitric oxide reductase transcription regulator